MDKTVKQELSVLQAHSLRELIEMVNRINTTSDNQILREDIVEIREDLGTFFLIYYK